MNKGPRGLPVHVHAQKRENGRMRYYFQRHRGTDRAGPRVRLPDNPNSEEFMMAYEIASQEPLSADVRYTRLRRSLDVVPLLRGAKQRAKATGAPFDLTEGDILEMMEAQQMRCAVTGVGMRPRATDDPFAWSIDRISGPAGYVKGNVRLVCRITNMAMNKWGERTLLQFIRQAYICTSSRKGAVTTSP